MARVTGLEPAASCVTGMRSNQLSYTRNSLAVRTYLMTFFISRVNANKRKTRENYILNAEILSG